MAQIPYRANLSAASFPLIAEDFGQSSIIRLYDHNYAPSITSREDLDKDTGIPQIYYGHNIMPTQHGFQSVGINTVIPPLDLEENKFSEVFFLRDAEERKGYLAVTTDGRLYIAKSPSYAWVSVPFAEDITARKISTAHVNGITYIYFSKLGAYIYDFDLNSLIPIALAGLVATEVKGVTQAKGYLIAWSDNFIAWSSTTDPTDFVPSLETGAGGGFLEDAKGLITVCVPHTQGFIAYTTGNAVSAAYSGNSRFPFIFKEVNEAGGLSNENLATFESNAASQYAYTTYGLQRLSLSAAENFLPAVTDFLAGSYFEDFDEATNLFSYTALVSTMKKKVTLISGRYLIFSYGINSLTHALVYDKELERMGKIKLPHVDCFEFSLLEPEVQETPRRSIGFLRANGRVNVVDFSRDSTIHQGVIIFGKFEYIRQRLTVLDYAAVENASIQQTMNCFNLVSLNGKDTTPEPGYMLDNGSPRLREYNFSSVGRNHSLVFSGTFDITSLQLKFHVHGRR